MMMARINKSEENIFPMPTGSYIVGKRYVYINHGNHYVRPEDKKGDKRGTRGYTGHDKICIGLLVAPDNKNDRRFYANVRYLQMMQGNDPSEQSDRNDTKVELSMLSDVAVFLKDYISSQGFEKLTDKPYKVYQDMVKGDKKHAAIPPRTARLVLVTLMSKTHEMAKEGCDEDKLTDHIQSEHCVNKKTAKDLASMYLDLFSEANMKSWDDAAESGFEEFCDYEWTIEWDGDSEWHSKHGSYPCHASASLTFQVQDAQLLHNHLSVELRANPFLSDEDIFDILEKEICASLDRDLDEYCDSDDYY
ncbi:MAG: hypothetical protein IJ229_07300, partial [Clostridia bacterium]|nr:hypothetical protein [Clostridia bacterium]